MHLLVILKQQTTGFSIRRPNKLYNAQCAFKCKISKLYIITFIIIIIIVTLKHSFRLHYGPVVTAHFLTRLNPLGKNIPSGQVALLFEI
jgi:hypothetical protein